MIILISKSVEENKESLKKLFHNTSDLVLYEFETLSNDRALVVYIDGIVDEFRLNEDLLKPLIKDLVSPWDIKSTVYISETNEVKNIQEMTMPIFQGNVVLFIEGLDLAYIFNLAQWPKRSVEQPTIERVAMGPKESFVEDIIVNKTLIRRRIMNNDLVFEDCILGKQTNTMVNLVYIDGIVKEEVLEELRNRIEEIQGDAILSTGYIEQYIDKYSNKLISTVGFTERPDTVAGKILEGCIAIISDGSPIALTVPKLFIENLHTSEDYYVKPTFATFLRILRFIAFFLSFTLPGIYISLILYHPAMVPTELLLSIAGQREGVPFASFFETFILVIFFDLVKEAGIRLPQAIGETVTLVGGLVIGQAAVTAGLASATMVIIVAAAGITEFVVPKLRQSIPILRIIFLFLGTILGLYGISLGLVFLFVHLVSINSFGVPYMWPITPYDKEGMKDTIIKYSLKKDNFRPNVIDKDNAQRRDDRIE